MENRKRPIDSFSEFLGGILSATEEKFQDILDEFIVRQDFGKKDAEDFAKKMKGIYDSNKKRIISMIDESVDKALTKANIARGSEIQELKNKIKIIEEKLNKKSSAAPSKSPSRKTAKPGSATGRTRKKQ